MDHPTLHYQPDSDEFRIQGYTVTDPQVLAGLNLPPGHTVVRVPTHLLPELQRNPDADDLLVQVHEVNDIELLTELNLPAGETVVRVAARLLPALQEGAPAVLTITELTEIAGSARHSLFRLETLDCYDVPIDGSDPSVHLAGGDQPDNPENWPGRSTCRPSGPPGSGGIGCTSSTPPTASMTTCATSVSGDAPRSPLRGRTSASSICRPPAGLVS